MTGREAQDRSAIAFVNPDCPLRQRLRFQVPVPHARVHRFAKHPSWRAAVAIAAPLLESLREPSHRGLAAYQALGSVVASDPTTTEVRSQSEARKGAGCRPHAPRFR